jgi:hypothetical protein
MSAPRLLVGAALLVALVAACGERKRPGPPSLTLDPPPGAVVTSPDTFAVGIHANDDNGLDSILVSFLDQVRGIDAFEELQLVDFVTFVVPSGYAPGAVLDIIGVARDLTGGQVSTTISVTVVDSSGAQR